MNETIIKSNDTAQEALEKIRAIVNTANKTILDMATCQHMKSQMRVTDIITKLAMDRNATHYIYGDSTKSMPIIGNGRATIENLVRLYFDNALKTQETPVCHCMDNCQCCETNNEHLSCIIRFKLYEGETTYVRITMIKSDEGLLKALTLTCEELGVVYHNMFDIKALGEQYKVVDNSGLLTGDEDMVRGERYFLLTLNRKLKERPKIIHYELDTKPFSCLIEQRPALLPT